MLSTVGSSIAATSPDPLTVQYVRLNEMRSKVRGPADDTNPDDADGVRKELV